MLSSGNWFPLGSLFFPEETNFSCKREKKNRHVYQPPANSTFLSEQTSHQQSANSTFLSEQISTSHEPPAKSCEFGCHGITVK
jgi:hypothetical protein